MKNQFNVIVVGAGHAGLEAAFACSHLNYKVGLFTLNKNYVADTPCNPSIGGPAKGVVTREIDALGGMQAKAADATSLQIKLLNSAKGAGVWALRSQIDKVQYHNWFINELQKDKNIALVQEEVIGLLNEENKVIGIETKNKKYLAKIVIITTGTYLKPITYRGEEVNHEGPDKQEGSNYLSNSLEKLGFKLLRLKTGTPARIQKDSIDYNKMQVEPGTNKKLAFSHYKPKYKKFEEQAVCYLTHTNLQTHEIINRNLKKSAMYSGTIKSIGPRYCPSIEDKVVRFADKNRHQVFVEPESMNLDTMYLQGLSTSFDRKTQEEIIHSIVGLENAKIIKYAYAIEYDAIDPTQLKLNYESKNIENLFFAGQINGTSGYEEAAAQGLMAGINASLKLRNQPPLILKRTESYIGVMTDDIMTKGITDPYRLLTSRAEHRLYLRNDNAQERLIDYGYSIGLVDQKVYENYEKNKKIIEELIDFFKAHKVHNYKQIETKYKHGGYSLYQLLKRPDIVIGEIIKITHPGRKIDQETLDKIEINIKFEGYIKNQLKNINKLNNLQNVELKKIENYKEVKNLSLEAIDKLNKIKPENLDQASRISGINMVDIAIIKYHIDKSKK